MKRLWLSLLIMMVVLVLSACGDSNSVEGTWKISDIDKNTDCERSYTFNDNHTFKSKSLGDNGNKKTETLQGEYKKIDDDKGLYKIKIKEPVVVKIVRDDNSLTMSDRDGSHSCTFDKK